MTAESQTRPLMTPDFTVGDWLVQPSLDCVSHAGRVRRLRPQLIDLLVLLARHAGQTVPKDVILAEVWQRQHVAESGLTRCITEIRQALGDDAHAPWMLQTIPKRGYRLVAPVVFLDAPPAVAAPPPPAPEGQDRAPAERPRSLARELGWSVGAIAGAVLVASAVWAGFAWTAPRVPAGRSQVLLADVTNTTGDAEFDFPLRHALAAELAGSSSLEVIGDERVRAARVRSGRPASEPVTGAVALDLCRREGAAAIVAASVVRLDSSFAVGLEATSCHNGESIARELVEVEGRDRVMDALASAASRLRARLATFLASARASDQAREAFGGFT